MKGLLPRSPLASLRPLRRRVMALPSPLAVCHHHHYHATPTTPAGSGSGGGGASSTSPSSSPSSSSPRAAARPPVVPFPRTPRRSVPDHIERPPYALTGVVRYAAEHDRILLHGAASADRMRRAARLARQALDVACSLVEEGVTTDELDRAVHEYIVQRGAYPSPLNYAGFPKSLCTSVNEIICHGIPDLRPLQRGDVVSLDVSCYVGGVHGDNCATVIVGDSRTADGTGKSVRGEDGTSLDEARRLVSAAHEALVAGVAACRPGGCLSDIGAAIEEVTDRAGYGSVRKYRGHGIGHEFHCAPFVQHYRNNDKLELLPGMIFTIEPMITQGSAECFEWDDEWTVSTVDGGLAAQFEHTVLITESGVEVLTLPE